jgi:sec-independent protein translocase protein TatA
MSNLGAWEILLILLVILLVFGAKRIPEIARGMGRGIREFKDATNDIKRELTVADTPPPRPPQHQVGYSQPPPYEPPAYPQTPEQAPPPAQQPGAPPPPAPPTEGQPPV